MQKLQWKSIHISFGDESLLGDLDTTIPEKPSPLRRGCGLPHYPSILIIQFADLLYLIFNQLPHLGYKYNFSSSSTVEAVDTTVFRNEPNSDHKSKVHQTSHYSYHALNLSKQQRCAEQQHAIPAVRPLPLSLPPFSPHIAFPLFPLLTFNHPSPLIRH